jgi:hypothetical protein
MRKPALRLACFLAAISPVALAGVKVTAPSNGLTVQSPVHYAASAGPTSCSKGVASMGIYTAPGVLAFVVNGTSLSTDLTLGPGTYNTVVEQWDYCGGAATTSITITVSGEAGVFVTAPVNHSSVSSPTKFSATAATTCAKGVGSMGIYTAPGVLAYVANGASLNTNLTLGAGTYHTVVEEWDNCGGATTTPVTITVGGSAFANLQHSGGWGEYGQGPPNFVDCSPSPCDGITFSMVQGIKSPSLSGASTQYNLGGTAGYFDALFNNHLIGAQSSQGVLDQNHTLVPTLHNFTYDVYFYGTNLGLSQALEFDINQFYDDLGFIWGHECRIAGGNEWDIWDNVSQKWVPTGVSCNPLSNSWNHLTIQVQRTSNNQLLYQSITLNGLTSTLDRTYSPGSTSGWWGVTINYQMDGNYKQSPYSVYLDNLKFSYD